MAHRQARTHVRRRARSPGGAASRDRMRPAGGVARFILVFVLVSAAGIGLEYYLMQIDGVRRYRAWVAEAGNRVPARLGVGSRVERANILVGMRVLQVTPECSGIEAMGLFCAGVIAFPCGWRKTLVGLMIGLVGVGVLNIVRVASLTAVAGWWPDRFEPTHDALTHLFPLFAVLPLWLGWLFLVARRRRGRTGRPGDGNRREEDGGAARPESAIPGA